MALLAEEQGAGSPFLVGAEVADGLGNVAFGLRIVLGRFREFTEVAGGLGTPLVVECGGLSLLNPGISRLASWASMSLRVKYRPVALVT
ncbi:hypothetical protein ACFWVC_05025 [Streptomyces sp. NPDC058691]|uniref:hypothetical protein n=1 Tax=Streptomyces sp. NPDC058691 TaxID=3346601 RepID=UPI003662BDAB